MEVRVEIEPECPKCKHKFTVEDEVDVDIEPIRNEGYL
jgi:hypothetical protein